MTLKSWREFSHCQVPVVRARVEDICRRVSGPRVLEIGANEGWVAKAINEERGFEVVAIDNRKEARDNAMSFFGIEVLDGDANRLPFEDASFDCVVLGEILEHLPNPGVGLAEAFRVSRGHVICTLPIGKYWNGEVTHAWQLNGRMIEHDAGRPYDFFKNSFVFEFRGIRKLGEDGQYRSINEGHEDR